MKLSARSLLSVLFAGLLASFLVACVVNLAFDMPQDLAADATGTTLATVQPVDLSQYQAVNDHKSNVQSLGLDSVDVSVTSLGAANKAHTLSGSLALRPDGKTDNSADVQVGTVTGLAISQGASFTVKGNSAIDAFLLSAIKGSGKFSVVVSGTTDGEAHMKLHAVLHANIGYGT